MKKLERSHTETFGTVLLFKEDIAQIAEILQAAYPIPVDEDVDEAATSKGPPLSKIDRGRVTVELLGHSFLIDELGKIDVVAAGETSRTIR